MYKIILKRGKEESLKRFHPWVFSGAIARIEGEPEEGEVVEVLTQQGEFIAKGHWQIGSIAVRVLSFSEEESIDGAFWHRRLATAYAMRQDEWITTPTAWCMVRETTYQDWSLTFMDGRR